MLLIYSTIEYMLTPILALSDSITSTSDVLFCKSSLREQRHYTTCDVSMPAKKLPKYIHTPKSSSVHAVLTFQCM
jgi:hypothetical protein